mmetsp:Transcript_90660/g.194417  ORF Transcript_90660/g.194417 Transcript_90660/m.194417 type:complete len:237 (-) Transcript_90660:861-1571(-)
MARPCWPKSYMFVCRGRPAHQKERRQELQAHHDHALVPPPIPFLLHPIGVVVGAGSVSLALVVFALVAVPVGIIVRPAAVHPVIAEATLVAVSICVEVSSRAALLAVDKFPLVPVARAVVEGPFTMPLTVHEVAIVAPPRKRIVGPSAVHLAVICTVPVVLVGLAHEQPEPFGRRAPRVALQVQEPRQMQLHLRHVAVDSKAYEHVHVSARTRLHEAVLDPLYHEVGAGVAEAEIL